jgi:iron complex transport system ATP-binding protein
MICLEARGLTLSIAGRTLCADLTAAFASGENWAILGANGSGKTSLLLALAGLRPVDRGEVLLHGRPLHDYPARPARGCARCCSRTATRCFRPACATSP